MDKKNILGEYSWFFKLSTWNYLYLHWINLYRNDLCRNDFVSKRPVTLTLRRGLGGERKKPAWALPKTPVVQANLKNEPELFSKEFVGFFLHFLKAFSLTTRLTHCNDCTTQRYLTACAVASSRPRGSQSGREKRRDESFQVRVFVAPFLPTRLTAPRSLRMALLRWPCQTWQA